MRQSNVHKRTGYVFAGSKTQMLSAMTMDASRPFYRLGSVRFLGSGTRPDFEAFLRAKFAENGFKVENPAAISLILDLAEEYHITFRCWFTVAGRNYEIMSQSSPLS